MQCGNEKHVGVDADCISPPLPLRSFMPSFFFLKISSAEKLCEIAGINFKTYFEIKPFANTVSTCLCNP